VNFGAVAFQDLLPHFSEALDKLFEMSVGIENVLSVFLETDVLGFRFGVDQVHQPISSSASCEEGGARFDVIASGLNGHFAFDIVGVGVLFESYVTGEFRPELNGTYPSSLLGPLSTFF
jgi:hypothetical protein